MICVKHSSRAARRRKLKSVVQSSKHVHPLILDQEIPGSVNELQEKADGNYTYDLLITSVNFLLVSLLLYYFI